MQPLDITLQLSGIHLIYYYFFKKLYWKSYWKAYKKAHFWIIMAFVSEKQSLEYTFNEMVHLA